MLVAEPVRFLPASILAYARPDTSVRRLLLTRQRSVSDYLCDARFRRSSEPSGKIQGGKAFYDFARQEVGSCDIWLALERPVSGMLRIHHQAAPPRH